VWTPILRNDGARVRQAKGCKVSASHSAPSNWVELLPFWGEVVSPTPGRFWA